MSEKMKKFLGIIAFLGLPTPCTVFSGYMHHKKILKGFFQHIRKFTKQNFNKIFFELCTPLVPLCKSWHVCIAYDMVWEK